MPFRLVGSPQATSRIEVARAWIEARAPGEPILVIGATADAANDLLRAIAARRGAAFGWHRATLPRLAAQLATPALVERGLAPLGALAREAVTVRVLRALHADGRLPRLARVLEGPGLARAVAAVLDELRHADVAADAIAAESSELAAIATAYGAELARAGLADRAAIFRLAAEQLPSSATSAAPVGIPVLLLDVAIETAAERDLVAALAARAPALLATVPDGDETSRRNLEAALGVAVEAPRRSEAASSLTRLHEHLFAGSPEPHEGDESVIVISAPGESRECVEIARRCLAAAAAGLRFDRIAILLRSPDEYRAHLEEAFARAGVPAHFARGAVRPDPAGRAFAALLACTAEQLSARRFAEYLSLGELPDATGEGAPPDAAPRDERWVAPDEELVADAIADALGAARADPSARDPAGAIGDPDAQAVVDGQLRAPRRWEQLLVDAAVIGGRARWERRLAGLARSLALDRASLDEPDGPQAERLVRAQQDLSALRDFALPLIGALDELPARASWGEWADALSSLATRALRRPDRVLAVLAELAPMADVAGIALEEVQAVLTPRLLEVSVPPPKSRYGSVFVAPIDAARGMEFDLVFVPGLAERLFPRKIAEDPILLDAARMRLGAGQGGRGPTRSEPQASEVHALATNALRVARERLALRIAVGAARERVVLSYPRLDLDEGRPRVPSFYALEALGAAEGRLPGFDELAKRAETLSQARVGWPAPTDPAQAIDEAEHDLALLDSLLRLDPERSAGTARYLLDANPHLARALRFRARRWWKRWTWADGLMAPTEPGRDAVFAAAREAIAAHGIHARSFSPTALQHFSACPYRFFLQAIHRLTPREVPEPIEELDPLQRGSLVHEVQFALFQRLSAEEGLPVTPANLAAARTALDVALDRVAQEKRDDWAPAIERVWLDGIESIRADLREWLRRMSEDDSGFVPWKFELAFGLSDRRDSDAASTQAPIALDCGLQLRGSIDLVERRSDGALRATDHKTGRERFDRNAVVRGGAALQPVLYALALEKRFPANRVEGGRLHYCTAAGGFTERVVPLDAEARRAAETLAEALDEALSKPQLPAAPQHDACRWCDYQLVCGPYEELRTRRKPPGELAGLERVRALR